MGNVDAKTNKTLHALISGRHPSIQKYEGKQVFVIADKVVTLKKGERGLEEFKRLKEKYGKPPTLIFVPHPGVSYILVI